MAESTSKSGLTVQKLTASLLNQQATNQRINLRFGDCNICVLSNSSALIQYLRDYFPTFISDSQKPDITVYAIESGELKLPITYIIKPPEPGKKKIKEEFIDLEDGRIVRKRLTAMVFLFGGSNHIAVGPCLENANQVINFINNRYIQWLLNSGYLLAHAAAVSSGEKGLAVCGFSGMGKSTLALHLMNYGVNFVSNDRLLVKNSNDKVVMNGVPKQPRINPGTILDNKTLNNEISDEELKEYKKLPAEDLWILEQKYDIIIERAFGESKFRLTSPFDTLVILNWKLDYDEVLINDVDLKTKPELLDAFIKSPGLFYYSENTESTWKFSREEYQKLLTGCRVIEMSGGVDFKTATSFCLKALNIDT